MARHAPHYIFSLKTFAQWNFLININKYACVFSNTAPDIRLRYSAPHVAEIPSELNGCPQERRKYPLETFLSMACNKKCHPILNNRTSIKAPHYIRVYIKAIFPKMLLLLLHAKGSVNHRNLRLQLIPPQKSLNRFSPWKGHKQVELRFETT